jgi:hypothetical protein
MGDKSEVIFCKRRERNNQQINAQCQVIGNVNPNPNDLLPHLSKNGYYQKEKS